MIETIELLRDVRADDQQYEVAWDGSFDGAWWRAYADPAAPIAEPVSKMHLVRDYLEAHPGEWFSTREVRKALDVDFDQACDRLCRLAKQGEVEREKGADGMWRFRMRANHAEWLAERQAARRREQMQWARAVRAGRQGGWSRVRKYRTKAEHAAMRARLQEAS